MISRPNSKTRNATTILKCSLKIMHSDISFTFQPSSTVIQIKSTDEIDAPRVTAEQTSTLRD